MNNKANRYIKGICGGGCGLVGRALAQYAQNTTFHL